MGKKIIHVGDDFGATQFVWGDPIVRGDHEGRPYAGFSAHYKRQIQILGKLGIHFFSICNFLPGHVGATLVVAQICVNPSACFPNRNFRHAM